VRANPCARAESVGERRRKGNERERETRVGYANSLEKEWVRESEREREHKEK